MWTLRDNLQGRRVICQANSPSGVVRGSWPKEQKGSSGSPAPVSPELTPGPEFRDSVLLNNVPVQGCSGNTCHRYTEGLRPDLKGKGHPAHPHAQLVGRDEIVIQGLEASHCTLFPGCTRGGSLGVPVILKCCRTSSFRALWPDMPHSRFSLSVSLVSGSRPSLSRCQEAL